MCQRLWHKMLYRSRSRKPKKKVLSGVRSSGLATVESRRGLECGTQRAVKESPEQLARDRLAEDDVHTSIYM